MGILLIDKTKATNYIQSLSDEFVLISNPQFVHPEFEIIPLAKKVHQPERLVAAVMDMDGTTTTTEELCVESLEFMIRKMSGLITKELWSGLKQSDYPNIIGNSTTKHIEYLIQTYHHLIDKNETVNSFIESVRWTIVVGKSEQRKKEVLDLLKSFNIYEQDLILNFRNEQGLETSSELVKIKNSIESKIDLDNFSNLVKVGIEIYYQHYHQYLLSLDKMKNQFHQKN